MMASGKITNEEQESVRPIIARAGVLSEQQKKRLYAEKFNPIEIRNAEDMRRVVLEMLKEAQIDLKDVQCSAEITWQDEISQKQQTEKVTITNRDITLYQLLISGLEVVKKRMAAIEQIKDVIKEAEEAQEDVPVQNMQIWDIDRIKFNVDDLICRKLGGKRQGLRVRWELLEGIFEFDAFEKKLYKVDPEKKVNESANPTDQSAKSPDAAAATS
jgi:hypothetical protein